MNTLYKNILASATLLVLMMTILIGCKDDDSSFNDVSVTAVKQFYEPADDRRLKLQSSGNMYFEWEKAVAADNSIVYYDVLFDQPDGDFSAPVYTVTSDNKGISNGATITHKVLNKIALLAGIDIGEQGTLKWTVRSSRGLNIVLAAESRTITLTRINSVPELEGEPMYIAGEGAAEAGQEVRPTGVIGEYDIYTTLTAGKPFYFESTLVGVKRYFDMSPEKDSFKEYIELPSGVTVAETGIYHIRLDFEAAAASIEKIDKLELIVAASQRRTELNYVGHGVWELKDYNVQLTKFGWGTDERYKFIFTVDGTEQAWGQKGPHYDNRPELSKAGYRDMAPTATGQWDGSQFKFPNELFDADDVDKYTTDVTVYMNLTQFKNYTHEFTNIRQ